MKDKIQKIRKACIKANPEIVELKFGCEVMIRKYKGNDVDMLNGAISKPVQVVSGGGYTDGFNLVHYINNFGDISVDKDRKPENEDGEFTYGKSRIKKIIGRPIRLADIFWTIEFLIPKMKIVWDARDGLVKNITHKWNLKDDNLENQSEETIEFIYNLLK